ncbi:MAG: GNAT family N-acetyltransferase [Rhodanobacteraceae bacterium]
MPFVNQLEPEILPRQFMAHPPPGFSVDASIAGVPSFTTRFDLLTTAAPALQRRVRALPGYRHCAVLLRPQTRFIGTTVSEYALFPHAADAKTLANLLVDAYAHEQPFLIVKDLPHASPLLDESDNAWADAFAAACIERGFVILEGQALAWVPIDFDDSEMYLARLSRGARRDVRRKLRTRAQLEVQALPTGSAYFADARVRAEFHALYCNVFAQSEIHFDRLSEAFLDAVLCEACSGGVVFVYHHGDELVGWNLCYVHAGMLVDKYVGFAYPRARDLNLYVISWMHNLEFARSQGLRCYVAGWTDPAIKAHLGARLTFTRHLVRPRSRLVRMSLRRLARHFESDYRSFEEQRCHATGHA